MSLVFSLAVFDAVLTPLVDEVLRAAGLPLAFSDPFQAPADVELVLGLAVLGRAEERLGSL